MKFSKFQPAPKWKSDLEAFAGWFSENGAQISPSVLTAFGIEIDSRHGKVGEIREMLNFAEAAAIAGVAAHITSVFYDSKSCLCSFDFKNGVDRQPDVLATIRQCALATIRNFDWDDGCYHGVHCDCSDCQGMSHGGGCGGRS